jgi:hypothetical protein
MWPARQGTVVSGRASPQPKQRKSPHEINRSVSDHRDTRAGPIAIIQCAKLTGAHYAGDLQVSHVACQIQVTRCIQVVHVIHVDHVVDVTHSSDVEHPVLRIDITRYSRVASKD